MYDTLSPMSYTVHFLTQDFELKTRCLGVVYFPESHTSENIAHGSSVKLARYSQICPVRINNSRAKRFFTAQMMPLFIRSDVVNKLQACFPQNKLSSALYNYTLISMRWRLRDKS